MGTTELFWKLVQRPVTSPNPFRIDVRLPTSLLIGAINMAASSAQRDVLTMALLPRILWKSPSVLRAPESVVGGSIASTKRRGESGSPWRRPWSCMIVGPATPFKRIREEEV